MEDQEIEQELQASAVIEQPSAPASPFNIDAVLTHWNVLLVVAVWSGIQAVRRALPNELFDDGKILARLLPLAPIVACNVAVWIPGPWLDPSETWGQRLMLGTVLGFATANVHTIAARLGLHQLLRVEADTRRLPKKKKVDPSEADTNPDEAPLP